MTSQPARRPFQWSYVMAPIAILAIIAALVFSTSAQSANRSSRAANQHVKTLQAQLDHANAQNAVLSDNQPQANLVHDNDMLIDKLAAQLADASGSQAVSLREKFATAVYAAPNNFTYDKIPPSAFGQTGDFLVVHAVLAGSPGVVVYRNPAKK